MSNISMVEAKLPAGFRFHPRDEELVCDYLMKKVTHCGSLLMIDVDLNKCEPWDIPEMACVGGKEWYFYTQRDRKYATGLRTNRATASGYWKATGKDRPILRKGTQLVGMRKTLVFYQGRAPKGKKTAWVMHEFRIEGPHGPPKISSTKEDWVLCRVFFKSRDVVAKPSMGSCCTGSSSLPALMDTYISFDQAQTHLYDFEQVPCFSADLFQNQTHLNPIFNQINSTVEPNLLAKNNATANGGTPNLGSWLNPNFSCDRKVLEAVLSQLTKVERNPHNPISLKGSPSLGDQGSSESYLSDVGMPMPNMWNNY